ncbi:helix-turn-helix domain-containing protein [Clostridium sp. CTA-7]
MNYIFMSESYISAFTDIIDAEVHKHYMLQLFMSYEDNLNIEVKGEDISCKCIIVNTNVEHCFSSDNNIHFTMLIDATSDIAQQFKKKYLLGKEYCVLDCSEIRLLQKEFQQLVKDLDIEKYSDFTSSMFNILEIEVNKKIKYDERILKLLKMLDEYDYDVNFLKEFSKMVSLSESRISHLFKEQIGIPLKSYIVLCNLKKAYMHLLKNGSITDAAMKAGFDSPSHFAYTSKKLTGMSAKNIRKDSVFLKVPNFKIE